MTNVALLEYFTSTAGTLVFAARQDSKEPCAFEVRRDPLEESVTRGHLLQCAERLIVDFHGLPNSWDTSRRADHFRALLALPPAVHAAKRSKQVLQINLKKPAFSYDLTYWEALSDALLPPDLKDFVTGADLLCIVPHGPLHSLPFAALRWSKEEYLVERFGLCYAHSASVLRYCQSKNRKRLMGTGYQPRSTLVAAVAASDDQDPSAFEMDGDMLASLFQERPGATGATRLIGANGQANESAGPASKAQLIVHIGDHDVIHLACHGVFGLDSSGDPFDSGLLLSDGATTLPLREVHGLTAVQRETYFLTAREVLGLRLAADLVTLRACSSGRADVVTGDELLGLTRAFLYAGTPSLVASLWNVNIRSSQRLLDGFYRRWLDVTAPMPKWQALQQAQLSLMHDPEFGHPYHWAPFVLFGDWE